MRLEPRGFSYAKLPAAHWVHRSRMSRSISRPDRCRYHFAVPPLRFTVSDSTVLSATPSSELLRLPCLAHDSRKSDEHTCLDFSPSSRHHVCASTCLRGFPNPRIRSVLRFSQPLDGLLRTHVRGLISSRYHVQDSPVQGVLLSCSHLSSSERACPLAVIHGALITEVMSVRRAPGCEASICTRVRCPRVSIIHRHPRSLPSSGFSPPGPLFRRAAALLGCSALDVTLRRLRFRARYARPSSASAPRSIWLVRLRPCQPARVFEPVV